MNHNRYPRVTTKLADDVTHLTAVQPYGVRFEAVMGMAFFATALAIAAAKGWGVI